MISSTNPVGFEVLDINFFEQTNYDFNLFVVPGDTIEIKFSYNAVVYGAALVKKIASYFIEVAKQVVENTDIDVEEVALIYPGSNKTGDLQLEQFNILKEDQGDFGF
jgi:iturin family lipopeptide synthetase B